MSELQNFALMNPISMITGKEREEFTREDMLKVIIEKQIERITFHYTALDGRIKELRIPVTSRNQAELILTEGERVDGSSLFKGIVDAGKSDLYVVPVYRTAFFNPFDDKSLDFICRFLDRDGNRASFAPDNILHNAHSLLKSNTGFELHALGELEFYLIGNHEHELYPMAKQKGYHGSAPFIKSGEILNEILSHITKITGNIKYAHYEVGHITKLQSDFEELNGKTAEQVEVEFLPTNIEDTADIVVLSSWIIRNVAYRHGFVATFFPKLEIGHAGNGMHFHMMLQKDGKNMMVNNDGTLSEESHKLIG
ncbi:MAG: glutamine synthetase beta-grasp domain-containing protein, partial [Bacteroidota bacterium]